ncbi:MAG: hypothetical protein L6R38_004255 [Xanthoria sp. 2 TBL-2021]|nr:MAG: hypothetical protein L6R38_004255 [Xanthoria sp. 2 TBL-2021]
MEQLVRQQPAGETAALPTRNLRNGPLLEKEDLNPIFGPADHRPIRTTSGLSLDDLEAAQALEGLRADCAHQPRRYYQNRPNDSKIDPSLPSSQPSQQAHDPEPLLALFTAQHPILSTAINGPLSAYTSSKSFSPRFKYGAELVERHVGSPVVSTVRTAGKYTGLETSVRWFLDGDRRGGPSRASKRRRTNHPTDGPSDDIEQGLHNDVSISTSGRQESIPAIFNEDLPPYDNERSPTYEQHDSSVQSRHHSQSLANTTWRTRLVMSTSGLGVAMSEESLRNLKYCLSWLRWGNDYLNRSIRDLQAIIREYNTTDDETSQPAETEGQGGIQPPQRTRDRRSISGRMHLLKSDIVETMSKICHVVSQYTGGALPANARSLVHAHLTALPGRFAYVLRLKKQQSAPQGTQQDPHNDSEAGSPTPEPVVDSAHRVLILASEGLDMIAQISSIVNGTITSAEEWCNRLGRNSGGGKTSQEQQPKQRQQQDDKKNMEQVVYSDSMYKQDEKEGMTLP